jgi:Phytanoyl-CoA hydroxylase-interacting protein C-terminus
MHSTMYCNSPCHVLYRNKSPADFADVFNRFGGIMKPYIKDNSGDQLSPINGQINGLFFMAEVQQGTSGEPCSASAFGSTRLIVPIDAMLELAPNLYFADYYCMKGISHYVTLVLTRPGSDADRFCSEYLLPLDLTDQNTNNFFFRDARGNMRVASAVKVEILFTEDVNIGHLTKYRGARIQERVPLIGKGHTTPGGVRKRADCPICNLYPTAAAERPSSRVHRSVFSFTYDCDEDDDDDYVEYDAHDYYDYGAYDYDYDY